MKPWEISNAIGNAPAEVPGYKSHLYCDIGYTQLVINHHRRTRCTVKEQKPSYNS